MGRPLTRPTKPLQVGNACENAVDYCDVYCAECFMVPNVVHYIRIHQPGATFNELPEATFLQYLSFLGVQQHIRPTHILIHGNVLPRGEWWRRSANDVANIYFVNMTDDIPTEIYGRRLKHLLHRTDLLRYRIVYGNNSNPVMIFVYYRCS